MPSCIAYAYYNMSHRESDACKARNVNYNNRRMRSLSIYEIYPILYSTH